MDEKLYFQELHLERDIGIRIGWIDILKKLPLEQEIECLQCDGKAPEPNFCGCGGKQTVEQALSHAEFELDILWNK